MTYRTNIQLLVRAWSKMLRVAYSAWPIGVFITPGVMLLQELAQNILLPISSSNIISSFQINDINSATIWSAILGLSLIHI